MYLQADLGSGCCCSGRWDLSQIVVGAGTSGISCGRTLLVGQVGQEQSARHQHKVFKGFPITVIQLAHMDSISLCSIHFFYWPFNRLSDQWNTTKNDHSNWPKTTNRPTNRPTKNDRLTENRQTKNYSFLVFVGGLVVLDNWASQSESQAVEWG